MVFYSMTETRPPHFGWKAEYLKLSKEVEQRKKPIPRFFALPYLGLPNLWRDPRLYHYITITQVFVFCIARANLRKIHQAVAGAVQIPPWSSLKREPRLFQLPQLPHVTPAEWNTSYVTKWVALEVTLDVTNFGMGHRICSPVGKKDVAVCCVAFLFKQLATDQQMMLIAMEHCPSSLMFFSFEHWWCAVIWIHISKGNL